MKCYWQYSFSVKIQPLPLKNLQSNWENMIKAGRILQDGKQLSSQFLNYMLRNFVVHHLVF